MIMKISCQIEIMCTPEKAFPWVAEPDKAMLWQKDVKGGKIIKETAEKIGTTFTERMEENGKGIEMQGIITDYAENKLISFHLESKIHSVDAAYSVVEGGYNKSIFKVDSVIHWKFPMNLISTFMHKKIKQGILQKTELELAELRRLCEK